MSTPIAKTIELRRLQRQLLNLEKQKRKLLQSKEQTGLEIKKINALKNIAKP